MYLLGIVVAGEAVARVQTAVVDGEQPVGSARVRCGTCALAGAVEFALTDRNDNVRRMAASVNHSTNTFSAPVSLLWPWSPRSASSRSRQGGYRPAKNDNNNNNHSTLQIHHANGFVFSISLPVRPNNKEPNNNTERMPTSVCLLIAYLITVHVHRRKLGDVAEVGTVLGVLTSFKTLLQRSHRGGEEGEDLVVTGCPRILVLADRRLQFVTDFIKRTGTDVNIVVVTLKETLHPYMA